MSETASAPLREAEPLHLLQPDIEHPAEHQLGDAVSPVKDERFISQVDQDHPHFPPVVGIDGPRTVQDRKSTRLNSSHVKISYAVFCLKKKTIQLRTGQAV